MPTRPRTALALLAACLALLIAGIVGGQVIGLGRPDLLIVPGATEVHIESRGIWEQRITYRAADSDYRWYLTVVRNLGAAGWSAPIDSRVQLKLRPAVYWRLSSLWIVYLKERVSLQGNPDSAQITIRREIVIPWQSYPRWLVRLLHR